LIPSEYGERFIHRHVVERNRHMIVSGGLGCSMVLVRLGVQSEIVRVELAA
jgi:predicted MPP superfamily phosphohydrolase